MTKTQIISIATIISKTNSNDNTRKTFTVKNGDAYFTPDGYVGYKIPIDMLYEVEEKCEIKIPEASESNVISNTFNEMCYKDYLNTYLNAKEFLAELKAICRDRKKTDEEYLSSPYIINFNGENHKFQIGLIIEALEILGNQSEIYLSNERLGKLDIVSDTGEAILLPMRMKEEVLDKSIANKIIIMEE